MKSYYFVQRHTEGTNGVRIGISKEGDPEYVYNHGAELRLASKRSAEAFIRLCEVSNLPKYGNMSGGYQIVEVISDN